MWEGVSGRAQTFALVDADRPLGGSLAAAHSTRILLVGPSVRTPLPCILDVRARRYVGITGCCVRAIALMHCSSAITAGEGRAGVREKSAARDERAAGPSAAVESWQRERIRRERLLRLNRERVQRHDYGVRAARHRSQVSPGRCICGAHACLFYPGSEIYSVPKDLRDVLENCLGEDPSPQVLATYIPEVRRILFNLFQGLQNKQEAYKKSFMGRSTPPYFAERR